MRLFQLLCLCLLSPVLFAQNDPHDFDEIVCKEAEAHRHQIEHAMRTNPLTETYDLKYYRFEWYIDPAVYFIQGDATVHFQTLADNFSEINFDFSTQLAVSSVLYHGQNLTYIQTGDYLLTIQLPSALIAGTLDSLTVSYSGQPPSNGFGSFSTGNHGGAPVLWTLSEPYGTQDWWPCKNGLTDKIDSIDVIITTPEAYRAASNGVLVEEYTSGTDKVYHWKHNYPITPYLVAIAVTNYVQYTDTVLLGDGTELPMLNYVYPESLTGAQTGTADLVRVLQYYDSLFITYPFSEEKYGHAQFGWGGGEEHQTMSFVVSFGFTLLSHELAHQWFGDMVTCGSWEDIWLNEGFATYLEGIARERFHDEADWYAWRSSRVNTITSAPGGSVKVNDTTSVSRIFSGRLSYSKGAYLLHMLRWKLGEDAFYQGCRDYLNAIGYGYAKTADLEAHLEAASGQDLTEFFEDWFIGEGYPSYEVTWQQVGDNFRVFLEQTTSHPSVDFFDMPVPIHLSGISSDTTIRLEHTHNGQFFEVPVSFFVIDVEFDPEIWLISRNNVVTQGMVSAVGELADGAHITLYPNPVDNIVHMTLEDGSFKNYHWQIVNPLGQQVHDGVFEGGTTQVDVDRFSAGIYQMIVTDEKGGMEVIAFSVH